MHVTKLSILNLISHTMYIVVRPINTPFHGGQPYDHTKEANQDSSAQKWSLNNAHRIHYPWICARDMAVDSIL